MAAVAIELGVTRQWVLHLITAGELPAAKQLHARGSPWLVEKGMYERWIQQQYALTRAWVAAHPRGGESTWS